MEEKVIGIDYKKEYEILTHQLGEAKKEIEKYKQALLNICLKV